MNNLLPINIEPCLPDLPMFTVVRGMDEWTRKVWAARRYGYSRREIAEHFGLTEPQPKLRFRYARVV